MEAANSPNTELIDSILDEALRRVRSGDPIDIDSFCQQHPDLADELRVMLPAICMLEKPALESGRAVPEVPTSTSFGSLNLADFQIVTEIGRGAMGVVYEAIQRSLRRRVALKIMFHSGNEGALHPSRFQREAEIAARLHHTNIVPVFEAGDSDGRAYYAMQFIDGANLQQIIAGQSTLDHKHPSNLDTDNVPSDKVALDKVASSDDTIRLQEDTVNDHESVATPPRIRSEKTSVVLSPQMCVKIAFQVAEGLDFAHERGILHRDIKPSNIILDSENRAWIADFGLAKSSDDTGLTATGDIVGTVRYLAPERFRGQSDQRSDIYALGLTLYEMLERKPAWPALDRAQLVQQIVSGNGTKIAGRSTQCKGDLRRIVEKATAHDPAGRYPCAKDMANDLRRYLDGQPVLARRQSLIRTFLFWSKRNRLVASLVATTFLTLLTGIIVSVALASRWRTASILEQANGLAATRSAESAMAEKARSNDLLKLSTSALSEMTSIVITDALASNQAMTDDQRGFLNRVMQLNEKLVELAGADPESRGRNAVALQETASIHHLLGGRQQALKEIQRALSIWRELSAEFPNRVDYQVRMGVCLNAHGKYLVAEWDRGQAIRCFLEARNCIEKFSDDQVEGRFVRELLAIVEMNIAVVFSHRRDYALANVSLEKSIAIQESLLIDDPGNLSIQKNLGLGYQNLSANFRRLGETAKAQIVVDSAIRIRRSLRVQNPNRYDFQSDLSDSLTESGKIAMIRGEPLEATQFFSEAQSLLVALKTNYPTVPKYPLSQSIVLKEVAKAYRKLDRLDESIKTSYMAIEIARKAVDLDPNWAEARVDLSDIQLDLAVSLQSSRPEEALAISKAGAENCNALVEIDPTLTTYREKLVKFTVLHGRVLWKQMKLNSDALTYFYEAERLLAVLMEEKPEDASLVVSQGLTCSRIGQVLHDMNDQQQAIQWFNRSVDLLVPLAKSKSADSEWRFTLINAYMGRGSSYADLLNHLDAIPNWERAIELETVTSTRLGYQVNLALSLAKTGQMESSLDLAAELANKNLSLKQHRFVARVFVILANQVPGDTVRSELLAAAAKQLQIVHKLDPEAVAKMQSDSDFKQVWPEVKPAGM